jgi:hypothetical protein
MFFQLSNRRKSTELLDGASHKLPAGESFVEDEMGSGARRVGVDLD